MRDVAVGVGELPTGECVGGEALVNEGKRAGDEWIGQLEVKLLDLRGQHEALVDDGATGTRGNVEGFLVLDLGGTNFVFGTAANAVKEALESVFVEIFGTADEKLLDVGLGAARLAADGIAVYRCVTPAEDFAALFLGDALEDAFALEAILALDGQEAHGHAVGAWLG